MRSRRPGSRRPAGGEQEREDLHLPTQRLNLGNISDETAWNQLLSLLTKTDYRVALILNSSNALQYRLPQVVLQLLQELSSYRTQNHSIVIYLFRETDIANLDESVGRGDAVWDKLYETVLRRCIDSETAETNRLISLRTPNAAEIRNLLNHLRLHLRQGVSAAVNPLEINELALAFADACGRKNWGLRDLLIRIENFAHNTPETEISLSNWKIVAEDENHIGPLEQLEQLVGLDELKEQIHKLKASALKTIPDRTALPAFSSRFVPF